MHVLITGANGFLGKQTVIQALKAGHKVRALSRRKSPAPMHQENLTWVQADLKASPKNLIPLLDEIDGVIHLAAAMTGDFAAQHADTVHATENLLAAMTLMGVTRLVAISSFSVYDYKVLSEGTLLDETAALESNPEQRDIYAQMKLQQEQRVHKFGSHRGKVTILRPGMIYGPDHLLNAFLGSPLIGQLWLRIGQEALLPLTHVNNCADAIMQALSCPAAIGQVFNIVDNQLPDQRAYAALVSSQLERSINSIVLPWQWIKSLANLAGNLNQRLGGSLKLPGLLVPARLHARYKPLQYTNVKAKQILGWSPQNYLNPSLKSLTPAVMTTGVKP